MGAEARGNWPRAMSNQIRVRLASQVACNGFFWPAQQMQFCPNMVIACCEPKSGQNQRHRYENFGLDSASSSAPPSFGYCRLRHSLGLAKCRRHFGQFLHLRKRSQDRLRACGDLTVFRRPEAATKKWLERLRLAKVEVKMPLVANFLGYRD